MIPWKLSIPQNSAKDLIFLRSLGNQKRFYYGIAAHTKKKHFRIFIFKSEENISSLSATNLHNTMTYMVYKLFSNLCLEWKSHSSANKHILWINLSTVMQKAIIPALSLNLSESSSQANSSMRSPSPTEHTTGSLLRALGTRPSSPITPDIWTHHIHSVDINHS